MTIDIIGAGIGGLTTAIALEQKGFQVRIFEQAESFMPIGAGIILANNAMQVYDKLGLKSKIEEKGNYLSAVNITKADLSPLSQVSLLSYEKKFKVKNIAIHRAKLQQILLNQLKSTVVHLNHRLTNLTPTKTGHLLEFANGDKIESTLLIGADGIHSAVREKLFSIQAIRKANQICWRGVTEYDLPENHRHELNEAWGKMERFGFVQIAKNKVYWYALKSFKNHKEACSISDLESYFSEFHPLVKALISTTEKAQVYTAEITDLKPMKTWYKANVCLIGDAAHAATPNMGQGACQAIEDADVLAECLSNCTVNRAFENFQNLRLTKAHMVVNSSWRLGKIAHLSNPILIGIRNAMLRLTPPAINKKQFDQLFKLTKLSNQSK